MRASFSSMAMETSRKAGTTSSGGWMSPKQTSTTCRPTAQRSSAFVRPADDGGGDFLPRFLQQVVGLAAGHLRAEGGLAFRTHQVIPAGGQSPPGDRSPRIRRRPRRAGLPA